MVLLADLPALDQTKIADLERFLAAVVCWWLTSSRSGRCECQLVRGGDGFATLLAPVVRSPRPLQVTEVLPGAARTVSRTSCRGGNVWCPPFITRCARRISRCCVYPMAAPC